MSKTWRLAGIVAGVLLALCLLWIVLLGPATLILLSPR